MGDFDVPKIEWVHFNTNSGISNSNYKFLKTTRDCFFQRYVKSSKQDKISDYSSLLDLVISNNDDLIDGKSLLSLLGKTYHCTVEVLVTYSLNNNTYEFYLYYNNANFDSMLNVLNDKFNITSKNFTGVNDQFNYFIKTLNLAKESFISKKAF